MAENTFPARSAVPAEHTWNAESVFASQEVWATELKNVGDSLSELEAYKGRLGESAATLADYFEKHDAILKRGFTVVFYANMSQACDSTDQAAQGMSGQAAGLTGRVFATISFLEPELLTIGEEKLTQWTKSEPRLAHYTKYFHDLFRQQAHVRSAEVEEVLGMLAEPFSGADNTYTMLTAADLRFKPASDDTPVGQGTIDKLLGSPDREARRSAWENYADSYLEHKNTFASNLMTSVRQDVFNARARRYDSSLEAALFAQNIPAEVFHNLINTYKKNIPTWHRYWAIRRRALGVDTLHPYDIWAPLTTHKDKVSYQQAVDWISDGMKPLGEKYVNTLRQGCLQDRWVDIYPNQGKVNGAFSYGTPGTYPFIMMSFAGRLEDMSTLAHELGHSMHSYLTWENQPAIYSNYSLFVAEVASNFNQAMVRAHLMEQNPDPLFQIALIEEAMSNFHRYFFIMPTLARFELEVHERAERGEGVTAEEMISLMTELFKEGYGGEMQIDHERVGITWAQFPHLYAGYYVFQYATGISGAHAFAERILAGEPNAAEDYVSFLSAGSSLYPLDALKRAGVDLTTSEAVEKTFAVLSRMVDRLEQLTANVPA